MVNLFPSFEVPDYIESESVQQNQTFPGSVAFDFKTGDFVRDGAGRPVASSGYDTWVQWCLKVIKTQRFSCLAYSSDIGVETDSALASSADKESAEAQITSTITDALMADSLGRTKAVGYFEFSWGSDSVNMSCVVSAVDGATANISVALN